MAGHRRTESQDSDARDTQLWALEDGHERARRQAVAVAWICVRRRGRGAHSSHSHAAATRAVATRGTKLPTSAGARGSSAKLSKFATDSKLAPTPLRKTPLRKNVVSDDEHEMYSRASFAGLVTRKISRLRFFVSWRLLTKPAADAGARRCLEQSLCHGSSAYIYF